MDTSRDFDAFTPPQQKSRLGGIHIIFVTGYRNTKAA